MSIIVGEVESVYLGLEGGQLSKEPCSSLTVELDGFVGDRHRSIQRECWEGDKQAEGSIRRNERQWSGVSVEELADIARHMDIKEPLKGSMLGANISFKGIPKFSQLPKGAVLKFSSGVELMVEEYNPPCAEMGEKIAAAFTTHSAAPLTKGSFAQAAKFTRGLVGVIEVAGVISPGDKVTVELYKQPLWLARLANKNN